MADLMSIARSGVLAAQQRLNVASNNIANAGTEGYNRQTVEQRTLDSDRNGNYFVGAGTYVSDIGRVYNNYAQREMTLSTSTYSQSATSHEKLSELDQILSQAGVAVPKSLNDLFSNINNVVDTPMDIAVRENTLTSAEQMAASFNSLSRELDSQVTQLNEQIGGTVERVNAITVELADINTQLAKIGGKDMNLLDQQDRLITELSDFVQVNVIPQEMGVKSVMAGGSMMLVAGSQPMNIGVADGDPVHYETRMTATIGNQTSIMPNNDVGGQLQALFDYRDNDLASARRQLDTMALGTADAFNQQQAAGFDLDGKVGQNMFTDINDKSQMAGRVAIYGSNTGDKQLAVAIDDVNKLTSDTYTLKFDGANYSLNDSKGRAQSLTVDPHDPGRIMTPEGFSLRIDGGGIAQAGDKWELQPNRGAATNLSMLLQEPEELAAAGYGLETTAGNGSATLLAVDRNATGFPANGDSVTVEVNMLANSFTLFNADGSTASGAIVNDKLTVNGITLGIDPSSGSGDRFSLDLAFGPADNNNAVAMAGLAGSKLMEGGSRTLHDVYEGMMTTNGGRANAAAVATESALIMKQQAELRVEQESGVNLDEEASDLMRFQQAYQASARVMTVAKETFDTLFNSVR
ncbi:flagellar hook-associated protein FlgK [uncultured Ferrimonas sp.]|uniref:flagellar hook-associated protein FlgK n=1 Tax=uncultured Ferrimonas sp. TaxID=432640 RepID=UPI00261A0B2C|nr:flagellar hook-associated protein FlgK [uncultured Ferrimonas sp.]